MDRTLSHAALLQVLSSLLADELKLLRPTSSVGVAAELWTGDTLITPPFSGCGAPPVTSLDADSFEFIALATRVNQYFQLHHSGIEDYLLRHRTLGEWAELVAEARLRGTPDIAFSTSGTTGSPKVCLHSWDKLIAEVRFFAPLFNALSEHGVKRVVALVPTHHIYGFLFGALLPQLSGVPCLSGMRALSVAQSGRLRAGDLVVGAPFIWQQLARQGLGFPEGVVGLTSTAPMAPEPIQQVKARGLQAMVEIYGASESAGIGYRMENAAGFELLPHWHRGDKPDSLLGQGGETLELEDQLHWLSDRHLVPVGRKDGAVQVGGINVYPDHIAARLEALPEIARARVRLTDSGRLEALLVPAQEGASPDELTLYLDRWCSTHLSAPETPRAFTFEPPRPSSPNGETIPGTDRGRYPHRV